MIALLLAGGIAVHVAGLGRFAAVDAAATHRYPELAEEVVLEQAVRPAAAFGGEVGLTWRLTPRLGLAVAGSLAGGTAGARVTARIPHPLYLARPRVGEIAPSGLRRAERAVHLGPVLVLLGGGTALELSAGATVIHSSLDVVSAVQYEHAYPFDEVRLTGVTRRRASDGALGFHVAGAVDRRASARLSVVAAVRYARAPTRPAFDGFTAEVDAGGISALVGLRLRP